MSAVRRGITVSIWIWITGGLLIAAITLAMAYVNLTSTACQVSRQQAIDQFSGVNGDIEFVCRQAAGTRTTRSVSLGCGVVAMFASDTRGAVDPKAPSYIAQGNTSNGSYVCLTLDSGHYRCVEQACNVDMTYVGTPAPGTDMYTIGRQDGTFDFDMTLRKNASGTVVVRAQHVP